MTALSRLLVAAGLACAGCGQPPGDEAPAAAPPVAVRVAPAWRGSIASLLTVSGETAALRTVRLASPVAGRITELSALAGDRIAANAVAARVLPAESEAAVHGLDVLRDAGALDADERSMAQRRRRDLAGRDIPLRVPFAAIVADRLHNPGERVAVNEVLLDVFDPQSLVVMAQVPMDASSTIHSGQPVQIRAGEVQSRGTVTAVAGAVTPQSLTVPVRIALEASLNPPLLHAAVECRIIVAEHADALLIPRQALQSTDASGHGVVMVAEGDHAVRREVQLGFRDPEHVEIIGGLAAGDLVLIEGGFALPDGAAIAPQPAQGS